MVLDTNHRLVSSMLTIFNFFIDKLECLSTALISDVV